AAKSGARSAASPGSRTLPGEDLLGYQDLLLLGGLVWVSGVLAAAVGVPRRQVDLYAAVVAVAGVDLPVPAGLALGDLVPRAEGGSGRGGSGDEGEGETG